MDGHADNLGFDGRESAFFDVFFDLASSGLADIREGYGGWVPEVYDLMEGDFEDDIPHILDLAERCGGPAADLGSGTGRLTLPLARAGFTVFALDSDPKMQGMLGVKAAAEAGLQDRIVQLYADIREFSLPEPANLAVCSTNTFLYLGSLENQRKCLKNLYFQMNPGGFLWLDVFVPKPNPSAEEPYLTSKRDPNTGHLLLYCAQSRDDHFAGVSHVNAFTMVFGQEPSPEIYVQNWQYAWLHPNELKMLLESTGFRLMKLMGDYGGDPADEFSVQMVAVAQRV